MPTAGLTAVSALFMLQTGKNDIAGGRVVIKIFSSCTGFHMQSLCESNVFIGGFVSLYRSAYHSSVSFVVTKVVTKVEIKV
jgi:hypothetical protein